jgi:hypothetical protein
MSEFSVVVATPLERHENSKSKAPSSFFQKLAPIGSMLVISAMAASRRQPEPPIACGAQAAEEAAPDVDTSNSRRVA